jgi:23S rRNA (guanosine2251-2'-O)-methyltransferase
VEQSENSKDYKEIILKEKNAVVMGNENFGVNQEVLKNSDHIAELPMSGFKNSLNVSVATGIILYSFFDK